MADKSVTPEVTPDASATPVAPSIPPPPPKRSPGHRGADVKDTVAEMTAKAHEISLEAGSKMAAAMKDVVNAAAGLTGFVLESARDLVQYMVRRGQMTQEEADKLIRQAEEAQVGRPAPPPRPVEPAPAEPKASLAATPAAVAAPEAPAAAPRAEVRDSAPVKPPPASKAAKPAVARPVTAKPVSVKPSVAKPAAKKPAARTAHKSDTAHASNAASRKVARTAPKKATAKRK